MRDCLICPPVLSADAEKLLTDGLISPPISNADADGVTLDNIPCSIKLEFSV